MTVRIVLTEPQWVSLTYFFEGVYGDEADDWDYYSLTHLQVWKRWFRRHDIVYMENSHTDDCWGLIKFPTKKQITMFLLQYPELGFIFDHNHNRE